jgi:DNA-binding CsgD family transcriptional regulator
VNATVLFGDVVDSRRDPTASTAWLRTLAAELEDAYPGPERMAEFEFTQGDELQGLLVPGVDPLRAVLRAWLHPDRRPMRWIVVAGEVDPGRGPATQRTGDAFLRARARAEESATRRDGLLMSSGDTDTDEILDDLTPLLAELLGDLTDRQRTVARLVLVTGLRRSEAAERLGVSRATISVAAERAHLRSIGRLAKRLGALFAMGAAAAAEASSRAAEAQPA